ncbi:ATP-dependent RecD-like DNA helicase [Agathobaculum sp. NTUH-O15-33]|uniref:SF1B family DNA helicase RecD2 n=1 Tax=Agathobaculum sp. NTUH-O15-33 TaxID=3079302 RepID=UPI002958A008|nr:ATP-dependent RecD-like DNA helicase [Agathobaculum sp. NTUH-O15-33]WNX83413.1 ATP-dependent RecD-like DNA helicase [Agathobaculum sp. NTUH-O15-33]
MDEREYVMIRGTVQQIVFYNAENGYAVLRLLSEDGGEVTATGTFPNIGLGEQVILTGFWVTHPSYGEQFSTEAFERRLPSSVRGIAEYLGSGLIRGVGQRLAARIAEKFGEDTFDILMAEPERLTELRGITERKAKEIGRQFTEQSEMRLLMDFLNEHALPLSLTALLYKRLGASAIDALCENPYLLCDAYYEIDFKLADALAFNLGLSMLSEERADAGVIYTLSFNLDNGHTFIPVEKLVGAVCALLSEDDVVFDENRALESIDRLADGGKLVREFIAGRDAVYLRTMHEAEAYLAEALCHMAERNFEYDFDVDELLTALELDSAFPFSENQKQAIAKAAKNGLVILTGGPGTGKTTTVRGILEVFEALGLNTLLAAPTGRAAKRLSELTGMEAKTIHRLLEAGYAAGGRLAFQRSMTNPLECDAVILDEVSMVDISLMQALIEALPYGARLILVGDADQLPPVGPGNFLRDLIGSHCVPTIELTEIFRQAQKSDIVMNAHAVNAGQMPRASAADGDFFIMKRSDPAAVIETIAQLCVKRLPEHYGFAPSQIQVLSPARRQGSGTAPLNARLQEALNPPSADKAEKRFGETVFREGDRVMQVRNNYDIVWEKSGEEEAGTGIFNGDVGELVRIYPQQECLIVRFDDKLATYTFDMLNELELAYAVTVHKAQGSEFDAVVLALSSGIPRRLLTRNILYTAITRAKRLLVIVGSGETITYMVDNNQKGRRYSALKVRLRDKWQPGTEKTENSG